MDPQYVLIPNVGLFRRHLEGSDRSTAHVRYELVSATPIIAGPVHSAQSTRLLAFLAAVLALLSLAVTFVHAL